MCVLGKELNLCSYISSCCSGDLIYFPWNAERIYVTNENHEFAPNHLENKTNLYGLMNNEHILWYGMQNSSILQQPAVESQ